MTDEEKLPLSDMPHGPASPLSEYATFYLTASSGSILELYRQILAELGLQPAGASRANLTKLIRREIQELHTLTQFDGDSKPYLPAILAGQSHLIDKLSYRTSQPLASRIVARSHLEGINRQGCPHCSRKKTVRHSYSGPCPPCLHRSVLKSNPKIKRPRSATTPTSVH